MYKFVISLNFLIFCLYTSALSQNITPYNATKSNPYVNSIGMKFVPVPIYGGKTDTKTSGKIILFSIWETRIKDYDYETDLSKISNEDYNHFQKYKNHPITHLKYKEVINFCKKLSRKEGVTYRLPTDHEWSCAVGIGHKENAYEKPSSKDLKLRGEYFWGSGDQVINGTGNYQDKNPHLPIEKDGYEEETPVGIFKPNKFGLYDTGGNAWEMCSDIDKTYTSSTYRIMRGTSYNNDPGWGPVGYEKSNRSSYPENGAWETVGFRCVIEIPAKKNVYKARKYNSNNSPNQKYRYPQMYQKRLSENDISNWTLGNIRYAINETYARHGADFSNFEDLQNVFISKDWYDGYKTFDEAQEEFSAVEKDNVDFLAHVRSERTGKPNYHKIKNEPNYRYPEMYQKRLKEENIKNWSIADMNYAIDETYVRHGYKYKGGKTLHQARQTFSDIEKDNIAFIKNVKRIKTNSYYKINKERHKKTPNKSNVFSLDRDSKNKIKENSSEVKKILDQSKTFTNIERKLLAKNIKILGFHPSVSWVTKKITNKIQTKILPNSIRKTDNPALTCLEQHVEGLVFPLDSNSPNDNFYIIIHDGTIIKSTK